MRMPSTRPAFEDWNNRVSDSVNRYHDAILDGEYLRIPELAGQHQRLVLERGGLDSTCSICRRSN